MTSEEHFKKFDIFTEKDKNVVARELKARLESLRTCYGLLRKHGRLLQKTLTEFQDSQQNEEEYIPYLDILNEHATLFGITSHAMMAAVTQFMKSAETDGHHVFKMLQLERERARHLENMVEDIAKQHLKLERRSFDYSKRGQSITPVSSAPQSDEDDDNGTNKEDDPHAIVQELSQHDSLIVIRKSIFLQKARSKWSIQQRKFQVLKAFESTPKLKERRKRRSRVPDRPNISMNAWSLLKNSIGKDLSKIPLPVNFNEPLTTLQRMAEEMEYSELLDIAAKKNNIYEQIAYVAAFTVSCYSSTANRSYKPFNPLLYETYEFDRREDLGWRAIAEQVSHHPPISAFHCDGRGWTFRQESLVKMKFKGKNLQITPLGRTLLKFEESGHAYSWNKATTFINNIIIGKMSMDHQGDVEIIGLDTAAGVKCKLTYDAYSVFSREGQRHVKGEVLNESNEVMYILQGHWDSEFEIAPAQLSNTGSTTSVTSTNKMKKEDFETIWTKRIPNPDSVKYHNFSKFTCELNEPEEGVAPTDSRNRPDLRLMEQGFWEESNHEKLRLEEKQRSKHAKDSKETEKDKEKRGSNYIEPHTPLWFERKIENGKTIHNYNNLYWEAKEKQNWSSCPDIF